MIKDLPQALLSKYSMTVPNEPILVYSGEFQLVRSELSYNVTGEISYNWLPRMGLCFSGVASSNPIRLLLKLDSREDDKLKITINNEDFGACMLTKCESNGSLSGFFIGENVTGDKSINVENVDFLVANLRGFLGEPIKFNDYKSSVARLTFNDDKWLIQLDKIENFEEKEKQLKDVGGYFSLYCGRLTSGSKSISYEEAKDVLSAFNYFLYFLNGRRSSAIIRQGIFEGKEIWCDFTPYNTDSRKSVNTWAPAFSIECFNDLWRNFLNKWKEDADFLLSATHWYVEANSNAAFIVGSIIIIQTALELIYNWYIVEQKKLVRGKDIENLSASNKIRLLLSQIGGVSSDVPQSLKNLDEFRKESNLEDGPEAFTQIRNAIVHSQMEKRKKLAQINVITRYEALQLGIWYVELSILKILDYNGKYTNRCLFPKFLGDGEDYVPWAKIESNR